MKVHEFKQYTATLEVDGNLISATDGDMLTELNLFLINLYKKKVNSKLSVDCVLKRRQRGEQWLNKLSNYIANRFDVVKNNLRKNQIEYNGTVQDFCDWFFAIENVQMEINVSGDTLTLTWLSDKIHIE